MYEKNFVLVAGDLSGNLLSIFLKYDGEADAIVAYFPGGEAEGIRFSEHMHFWDCEMSVSV